MESQQVGTVFKFSFDADFAGYRGLGFDEVVFDNLCVLRHKGFSKQAYSTLTSSITVPQDLLHQNLKNYR